MKTSDFDFQVPPELIAHEPAAERDQSRLMIVNRKTESLEHRKFCDIIDYLHEGDLLVLNDTKVIPANLVGRKEKGIGPDVKSGSRSNKYNNGNREEGVGIGGGKIEVLLVREVEKGWLCLVKPGKRLTVGSKVVFGEGELVGTCVEKLEGGEQIVSFEAKGDFWEAVHKLGEVPLPPYIKKMTNDKCQMSNGGIDSELLIKDRYQTVYADKEGASAAPTAGLHFTPELLDKIRAKGIKISYITLHTGLGTFQPVRVEEIEDHPMHSEYFEIPEETISDMREARRVIAVGTTSVRALESFASKPFDRAQGESQRLKGETKLFIYPGYKFKVVDAMITNFHWPKTTLVMLVSAFAGKDFIMKAYQKAINQKYRFFSFGDAMLIL